MGVQRFTESWVSSVDDDDDEGGWCAGGDFSSRLYTYREIYVSFVSCLFTYIIKYLAEKGGTGACT